MRDDSLSKTSDHHKTYDVGLVASNLPSLHEAITRTRVRIEITRPGTDERCIMLSKEELDSLEVALEILSRTDRARDMGQLVAELAAATGPSNVAVA